MATIASTSQGPATGVADASAEAMRFVQELAAEVNRGPIELPSYPEVALRVQRVLADSNADVARVVKVIGGEPVLASRIITMANSAALNPSGKPATELREAVARVGFDALRSAAIGFAVAQLRKAAAYRGIEKPMTTLWQQNVATAATCFVLARKGNRFAPDTAMLAGLVSGVGKLYILTRSSQYPALFGDPASYHDIVHEWHSGVARSLLENWGMADEIIEAVAGFEAAGSDEHARVTLADVLAAASLLVEFKDSPDLLAAKLQDDRAAARLGLTTTVCEALLNESAAEVAALREALGT
jgi:HD-like signal output (HDOD) protein